MDQSKGGKNVVCVKEKSVKYSQASIQREEVGLLLGIKTRACGFTFPLLLFLYLSLERKAYPAV